MARVLFDTGIFSVLDEASAIGIGWRLSFFTADTVSQITTYTLPVGGVANTNPVLSDAEGRWPAIWINEGQSIKWQLADESGVIKTTLNDYDIPETPPSFDPDLDDFLAGNAPLPIASGGTGQTSAVNAIAALGGLPTAGGTMTANITRSTKGVYTFWDAAAMANGNIFLVEEGDPDPATLPGQITMFYTP